MAPLCACGCGKQADTVRDGRNWFGDHRDADVPLTLCALDGCGSPAAPNSTWCLFHAGVMGGR